VVLFLAGPEQITLPIRLFEGIRDELTPFVVSAASVMILISVGLMALLEGLRRSSQTRK
jgi:putative spermidine/putrescine transport system permease protein